MAKREEYEQIMDGQTFNVPFGKQSLKVSCCSCGLVHSYGFKQISPKELAVTVHRLNRETANLRRYKNGELFAGEGDFIIKRVRATKKKKKA